MGEKVDRLEVRLARVYIPPHKRVVRGKIQDVDGYWRELAPGQSLTKDEQTAVATKKGKFVPSRSLKEISEKEELAEYEGVPEGPQPGSKKYESEGDAFRKLLAKSGNDPGGEKTEKARAILRVTREWEQTTKDYDARIKKETDPKKVGALHAELAKKQRAFEERVAELEAWHTGPVDEVDPADIKVGDRIVPSGGGERTAVVTEVVRFPRAGIRGENFGFNYKFDVPRAFGSKPSEEYGFVEYIPGRKVRRVPR